MESLSAYARQFLGNMEKPDVDAIDGLSPAISIDQKTTSKNPRSTVGTTTEINDYLRLLYARVGTPYCINGHGAIKASSVEQIVDKVLDFPIHTDTNITVFLNLFNNTLMLTFFLADDRGQNLQALAFR